MDAISTQPPISFDTLLEDFRCSISSVPAKTSKSLPSVSNSDPYSLEDEFRHILFSPPPISRLQESAVEKLLDIERATGFEDAEPPVLNILIDRSWTSDMAVRWTSAIVFPDYPNFSAYAEKTRFVKKSWTARRNSARTRILSSIPSLLCTKQPNCPLWSPSTSNAPGNRENLSVS